MPETVWSEVRRLLQEVIDLPARERGPVLDRVCQGKPALRAEVDRYLAINDQTNRRLDPEAGAPTSAVMEASGPLLIGEIVGPCRILRLIGAGGMGAVYEAALETDGTRVALKVLGGWTIPGESRRSAQHRMIDETRVLETLKHPGIAAFLRSGAHTTRGGTVVPYFILELVRGGRPITDFARRAILTIPQRVTLLADTCEAVGHAHHCEVFHRDLKPENLLVDERGRVKVIDFGIARAPGLLPDSSSASAGPGSTRAAGSASGLRPSGGFLGTLRYMSPEQVDDFKPTANARSDVYALGVVMHELLAERPPYLLGTTTHSALAAIKNTPATPLGQKSRRLRGDLAWIAHKALSKDPAQRYQDAADMAADLRRVLAATPALARPPSLWQRLASRLGLAQTKKPRA